MDLKQVDPAIMQFAANTNVTRYNKKEMEVLRESTTSQAPPPCLYDPKIIRLNILKCQKNHPEDYESQMKTFRELLPNLSMSSWDPNVLELLNNYHKTLLVSHNYVHNGKNSRNLKILMTSSFFSPDYNAPRAINQNFNRKVSWGDQKQFMDTQRSNIPPYDQK